jgi:ASPIC and UnbV
MKINLFQLSQSDLRLHFRLADLAHVKEMKVVWPDGKEQAVQNIDANHFYPLKESGALAQQAIRR